jgi:hypothetical protein
VRTAGSAAAKWVPPAEVGLSLKSVRGTPEWQCRRSSHQPAAAPRQGSGPGGATTAAPMGMEVEAGDSSTGGGWGCDTCDTCTCCSSAAPPVPANPLPPPPVLPLAPPALACRASADRLELEPTAEEDSPDTEL